MVKAPRKTVAKKVTAILENASAEPATLKSFRQWDGDFAFTRYWWLGEGARAGIAPVVRKRMQPGDDPKFGNAAKIEVLLSPMAPSDYANVEFLLERFDGTLPPFEFHAMVQVKITLDPERTWHDAYEEVRAYARAHFARRFPVIMVAHVPALAGLDGYGSHVHCIVLSRWIGINGLGGACSNLCSDRGYAEALAAWRAHQAREEV